MNAWTKEYYLAHLTRKFLIPEPPRNGVFRKYNPNATFFNKFTLSNDDCKWRSTADILDLTRNYWEKTPTNETFFFNGATFYLIPNSHELYWLYDKVFVNCGPKYLEDQYDEWELRRTKQISANVPEELQDKLILALAGVE